jgi:diacylglycerol kinase (CTP)
MRETEVEGYNGVIWYLVGAFIALRFYPKDVGVVSILLLSWCDTAASTFGRLYGRYTVRLRRGKSLAGSLAAFATGALVAVFFWGWLVPRTGSFPDDPINAYMFENRLSLPQPAKKLLGLGADQGVIVGNAALAVMSICTGVIASLSELVDLWGWDDNLTIPLLSSAGLWAFLKIFG